LIIVDHVACGIRLHTPLSVLRMLKPRSGCGKLVEMYMIHLMMVVTDFLSYH